MSLSCIINQKNEPLLNCSTSSYITDAIEVMVRTGRNALAIFNAEKELSGILTFFDVIKAINSVGMKGIDFHDLKVKNWMTAKVISVQVSSKLTDALKLMGQHKIHHLAVKDGEVLLGLISISDILAQIQHDDALEISVLRDMARAKLVTDIA